MLKAFLTRSRIAQQPFLWMISACSCGLSLFFTLSFCRHLWPQESALVVLAFGLAWELAKLQFGPRAFLGGGNGRKSRTEQLCLLALTAVLMTGSILASFGHFAQAHNRQLAAAQAQQTAQANQALQATHASDAYQAARRALTSLDFEIDALTAAVADDMAHHFRSRAMATMTALASLRERRDKTVGQMAQVQTISQEMVGATDFFGDLGAMLPGDSGANAGRIKVIAHLILAIMLEIVGIAAWSLIAQAEASSTLGIGVTTTGTPDDDGPGPKKSYGSNSNRTPNRHTVIRPISELVHRRTPRGTRQCAAPKPHSKSISRAADPCEAKSIGDGGTSCTPDKYNRAKELITSGTLTPSHRGLRLHLKIGQKTARAFLQRLCLEGHIRKAGRRYRLARFAALATA
jgi:hypothetical protein